MIENKINPESLHFNLIYFTVIALALSYISLKINIFTFFFAFIHFPLLHLIAFSIKMTFYFI